MKQIMSLYIKAIIERIDDPVVRSELRPLGDCLSGTPADIVTTIAFVRFIPVSKGPAQTLFRYDSNERKKIWFLDYLSKQCLKRVSQGEKRGRSGEDGGDEHDSVWVFNVIIEYMCL